MTPPKPTLAAIVDGAPLGEPEARALWKDFSTYMDEHVGDMAGFAKQKGWQSVAPEYRKGQAVLLVKTGAAAAPRPPKKRRPA